MTKIKFSASLHAEITSFLETVTIKRLNRELRSLLLAYLQFHKGGYPLDHHQLLSDLEWLFELVDVLEKEQRKRRKKG